MTDIEQRVALLRADIKSYGADIINYVNSLYSPSNCDIDIKNDPRNILKVFIYYYYKYLVLSFKIFLSVVV